MIYFNELMWDELNHLIVLLNPLVFLNNRKIYTRTYIYIICYRPWIWMHRVHHEIKPGTAFRRWSRHMSCNQYQMNWGLSHTIYLQWKAIGQVWLLRLPMWYHVKCDIMMWSLLPAPIAAGIEGVLLLHLDLRASHCRHRVMLDFLYGRLM